MQPRLGTIDDLKHHFSCCGFLKLISNARLRERPSPCEEVHQHYRIDSSNSPFFDLAVVTRQLKISHAYPAATLSHR